MAKICGTVEGAEQLKKELVTAVNQAVSLSQQYEKQLSGLSDTVLDDSFQEMSNLSEALRGQIGAVTQDAMAVIRKLDRYIAFLRNRNVTEASLSGRGVQGRAAEVWHMTDEGMLFDSPDALAARLNTSQGFERSVSIGPVKLTKKIEGTCGLCSVQNSLTALGIPASEEGLYDLARSQEPKLCSRTGGTSPESRQQLLAMNGVSSHLEPCTTESIASAVESGHMVIISVDAGAYYGDPRVQGLHALTVTSVTRDESGNLRSLVICDSNGGGARRVPSGFLSSALSGRDMNVTDIMR